MAVQIFIPLSSIRRWQSDSVIKERVKSFRRVCLKCLSGRTLSIPNTHTYSLTLKLLSDIKSATLLVSLVGLTNGF